MCRTASSAATRWPAPSRPASPPPTRPLFDGAAWVLCVEDDTDLAGWLRTAELVTGAGCHVVPCTAPARRRAGPISGLPHLLAVGPRWPARTAARSPARSPPAPSGTAPGWPAARPELIAALCDGNAAALVGVWTKRWPGWPWRGDALRAGGTVHPLAAAGHAARRAWSEPVPTVAEHLDARAPDFRSGLRDLGAAGGSVYAVHPDGTLHCRRPER